MNAAKQLKKEAKKLGWSLLRSNGKHQIWQSASGHRMPLPGTPKAGARTIENIKAKLKRYA